MSRFPLAGPHTDRVRRRVAWAAPVLVAAAVVAGVVLTTAFASGASPTLPSRTAAQLIAAVLRSDATTLSGEVQETANLGVPSLPGDQSGASLSWQTFITGTHSARVWVGGPDKQRVALLGELSEADVVRNGADVWTYTSDTNTVTHSTLPNDKNNRPGGETPSASDVTPAAVAARVLKAVGPSTAVTVDPSTMVANRAAYTLAISPRDANSTVRKVTIAIDAKKYVPLQVQVFGSSSTPAFQTGFTSISFGKPSASTFTFHTPAGATVSNDPFGTTSQPGDRPRGSHSDKSTTESGPAGTSGNSSAAPGGAQPKVLGQDWTSVVEVPAGSQGLGSALGGSTLNELTTPVGNSGARLLHTALLNAVILADGRTFIGAVQPALLEHIAATTPN
ncbi:MAG: hypothetical protein QOG01_1274 [Pseudonocardiales bacterium]|jgi:outer membrane lipoprotein-sorting protein|nr:hypothetical protein [Pseudonocardiales bacterium]